MDPVTMGLVVGGMGALGSMFSSASANATNLKAVRETNKQNLALTKEAWQRDDTAVQRRQLDLEKAGISPLLAAGGTGAPNSGPANMIAPHQEKIPTDITPILNAISAGSNAQKTQADISAQQQQIDIAKGQLGIQQADLANKAMTAASSQIQASAAAQNAQTNAATAQSTRSLQEAQKNVALQMFQTAQYNLQESIRRGVRTGDDPNADDAFFVRQLRKLIPEGSGKGINTN